MSFDEFNARKYPGFPPSEVVFSFETVVAWHRHCRSLVNMPPTTYHVPNPMILALDRICMVRYLPQVKVPRYLTSASPL